MRNCQDAAGDTEIKSKGFGAFMSSVIYGKFEKLAHSLRGGSPIADVNLYGPHIPGEAYNSSGVDDPKLTEMIKLQRRTLDVGKRRELVYDNQRYLAEQGYYAYDPSYTTGTATEPHSTD